MGLLEGIVDREDEGKIIIDADSLLFFSCYQHREDWNIELAYMNFMERVGTIRTECYTRVIKLSDLVISFTTNTNFRYDIYPEYKANRKKQTDEDAIQLGLHVKELKKLIYKRLKDIVVASNVFEADDLCIQYAYKGYFVAAIDKDVINACPTECFNYKKAEWSKAKSSSEIRDWYLIQSIAGDTSDNIVGVKGMGLKKAEQFLELLDKGVKEYQDYIDLFPTPKDCLVSNQLVRMNQYEDGELKLIDIQGIVDEILPF